MPEETRADPSPEPSPAQGKAAKWIALAATCITVALPAATWVRECGAKDRELTVAKAEQQFQMRSAYLDRALDPARPAELREAVLRFLRDTSEDKPLRDWAESELNRVNGEVRDLKAGLSELQDQLQKQQQRTIKLIADLKRQDDQQKLNAQALAEARTKITELEASRVELQSKIAGKSELLTGSRPAPPPSPYEGLDPKSKSFYEMVLKGLNMKAPPNVKWKEFGDAPEGGGAQGPR